MGWNMTTISGGHHGVTGPVGTRRRLTGTPRMNGRCNSWDPAEVLEQCTYQTQLPDPAQEAQELHTLVLELLCWFVRLTFGCNLDNLLVRCAWSRCPSTAEAYYIVPRSQVPRTPGVAELWGSCVIGRMPLSFWYCTSLWWMRRIEYVRGWKESPGVAIVSPPE